jgi:cytochrome b561
MAHPNDYDIPIYSRAARRFHWWVALFFAIQFALGFYMTYRGYDMVYTNDAGETKTGLFDAVTGALYDSHKLLGVSILLIVLLRLGYRLTHGAPPSDRSLPPALTGISHLVHWSIYLLLIAVPIGGYIGVSYYGALNAFDTVPLPPVTEKDQKMAEVIFEYHKLAAWGLLTLVGLHIAAAIYHRFIRKDRVVERMLPRRIV